jgi:hypothetical protein
MNSQEHRDALLIRVPGGDSWSPYYVLTWPDSTRIQVFHSGIDYAVAWIGESLWPSEVVILHVIHGDTPSSAYRITVDSAGNCESRQVQ